MVLPCTGVQGERASDVYTTPVTPLKIVHVIASIDPATGGPATVITRLAAAQATQGHDVTIVSSLGESRRDIFTQASSTIPGLHRVKFNLAKDKASFSTLLNPVFWSNLSQRLANADVIHLHGVWDPILLAASKIARRHNIPYVVRPCGMLDPWALQFHGGRKKVALALGFRKMLDHAAFIHVLNQQEANLIEPLNLAAPRKLIPNGVFADEMTEPADKNCFTRAFPALQNERFILFLARLHEKKGLDLLADAFAKLAQQIPDVHLVVAGPDDGAGKAFTESILRNNLTHRVHKVGPLYGAMKFSALHNASCFCLPSRQEGFSLAVTEALGCGVPVAISHETHFPEAAEAGAGVEFDLNVDAITQSLKTLLNLPVKRLKEMSAAGQMLVRENYTWPRIASLAVSHYHDVTLPTPAATTLWQRSSRYVVPALRAASLMLATMLIAGSRSTPQ